MRLFFLQTPWTPSKSTTRHGLEVILYWTARKSKTGLLSDRPADNYTKHMTKSAQRKVVQSIKHRDANNCWVRRFGVQSAFRFISELLSVFEVRALLRTPHLSCTLCTVAVNCVCACVCFDTQGAALIRMLTNVMGQAVFQKGINVSKQ